MFVIANKVYDLTGMKFGRWTILNRAGNDGQRAATWLCRCDCGTERVIRGYALRYGHTRSCGCLQSEQVAGRNRKHDGSHSRLYRIWNSMKKRCSNPNDPAYKNYGGRGIKVCDEWSKSFSDFRDWAISSGYDENAEKFVFTIDRIDVNGNYCPDNCRWATPKMQCNNRRNNRNIIFRGECHTISEWSSIAGTPQDVIRYRLKAGWSTERAITEKVRTRRWWKKPKEL